MRAEKWERHMRRKLLVIFNIYDMIDAIGIGADKVCTYCWNGKE